jgi:hypothetical protein
MGDLAEVLPALSQLPGQIAGKPIADNQEVMR